MRDLKPVIGGRAQAITRSRGKPERVRAAFYRHRSCYVVGHGYPSRAVSKRNAAPIEKEVHTDDNEEVESNGESGNEAAELTEPRRLRARSAGGGWPRFAQVDPGQRKPGEA